MQPSRSALALVLLAGCAAPAPAAPVRPAASAASVAVPAAPRLNPEARALLDAWEQRLPTGWQVDQRGDVGSFSFVLASERDHHRGAIATARGVLTDLNLAEVWSEPRDLDGDGRSDLVAITFPDDLSGGTQIAFEALTDGPTGPVRLPVEGLEPAPYRAARWAPGSAPAIELGTQLGKPLFSQVFAWNGKALAPRDLPFFYIRSWAVSFSSGNAATMVGLAHGKRLELSFDPGKFELPSVELPIDLGDGPRFLLFDWLESPRENMDADEFNNLRHAQVFLRADDTRGFEEVKLPRHADLTTLRDRDGDGKPEFEVTLPAVSVVACPRGSVESCEGREIQLRQLSAWADDHFAPDHPGLTGAYLAWAAEASKEGSSPVLVDGGCSLERMEFAMQAYMGLRRGGKDTANAHAEATRLLQGTSTQNCGVTGSKPRPVAAVIKDAIQRIEDTLAPRKR